MVLTFDRVVGLSQPSKLDILSAVGFSAQTTHSSHHEMIPFHHVGLCCHDWDAIQLFVDHFPDFGPLRATTKEHLLLNGHKLSSRLIPKFGDPLKDEKIPRRKRQKNDFQ
jgi:hypothetical protein